MPEAEADAARFLVESQTGQSHSAKQVSGTASIHSRTMDPERMNGVVFTPEISRVFSLFLFDLITAVHTESGHWHT